MSYYELDAKSIDKIIDTIMQFEDGSVAEDIINDYLEGEGGDLLKESIHGLLPVSGREPWKGKKAAAKSTDPFKKTREEQKNMSIKIHTKYNYHYLYFPDDGSDTDHHEGNQQFMFEGADKKAQEVGENILEKLIERLED